MRLSPRPCKEIGPELPIAGDATHGPQDFTIEQEDTNIPVTDFLNIFLNNNRVAIFVRLDAVHIEAQQRIEVLRITVAELDDSGAPESQGGFHDHVTTELLDDLAQSNGVSGYMSFRDDVGKVEHVELARRPYLPSHIIDDEHLIGHELQKVDCAKIHWRVFPQEQGVQFSYVLKDSFFVMDIIDENTPGLVSG
jgi:hypothetical protein